MHYFKCLWFCRLATISLNTHTSHIKIWQRHSQLWCFLDIMQCRFNTFRDHIKLLHLGLSKLNTRHVLALCAFQWCMNGLLTYSSRLNRFKMAHSQNSWIDPPTGSRWKTARILFILLWQLKTKNGKKKYFTFIYFLLKASIPQGQVWCLLFLH